MAKVQLGEISTTESLLGRRDAFHVCTILVTSDEMVAPGESVKFVDNTLTKVKTVEPNERHGVADPLIKSSYVFPKQLFWVIVEPSYISNLVHHFHLDLPDSFTFPSNDPPDDDDDECRNCDS